MKDPEDMTHPCICPDCGEWCELHESKEVGEPGYRKRLVCKECAEDYDAESGDEDDD